MRILLRRLEPQGGQQVVVEQRLDADRLTIGRDTKQLVEIADLRVALAHAEISLAHSGPAGPGGRGRYLLKTIGRNAVWVNGAVAHLAELRPGDTVDIGRFRLTLEPPDADSDLVVQIKEQLSAREEKSRRQQRFVMTLAQAGAGKRGPAWLLGGTILVLGLLAPLVLRHLPFTSVEVSMDRIWQAGAPSSAHSHFMSDCKTCHEVPFVRVRNDACLACHQDRPQHSDRADILALDGFADARCGACHLEHSGPALIARKPALCTACHAAPDDDFAMAQLPAAKNFEQAHPEFTLRLPQAHNGAMDYAEFAQSAALREQSNLLFPHDVHVSALGIGSPAGRKTMDCTDCHQPSGRSFAPVRMEQHCLECHRLDFDPNTPDLRLPHGPAEQAVKIIRDHFARVALAGEAGEAPQPSALASGTNPPSTPGATADKKAPTARLDAPAIVRVPRRPGEILTVEQRTVSLSWADAQAGAVIDEAFGRRICRECHEVERTDRYADPWTIVPVAHTASFLTGARFDHAAHRTQDCGACHAADKSVSSSDVLIPDLASCRSCHGDPDSSGLVPTACVDCHGFHIATEARFEPAPP